MNSRTGIEILTLSPSLFKEECNNFSVGRNVFPFPYQPNAINFVPVILFRTSVTLTKALHYA